MATGILHGSTEVAQILLRGSEVPRPRFRCGASVVLRSSESAGCVSPCESKPVSSAFWSPRLVRCTVSLCEAHCESGGNVLALLSWTCLGATKMPHSSDPSLLSTSSLQGQVRTTGTQLGYVYKSDPNLCPPRFMF